MDGINAAIILDGNRRWAKERGLKTFFGHKKGAENVEKIAKEANKRGMKNLYVYIFSTENWKRSDEEVTYLMKLFKSYFKGLKKNADKDNIRVRFIGTDEKLSSDIIEMKKEIEESTKENDGMGLNICFNYGGRNEILEMTKRISKKVLEGEIKTSDINEEIISHNLYTNGIDDPDILIRTSGEQRLSNFLPWQLTYTELFFVDKAWPEFTIEDLEEIVSRFKKRNRRFGAG